MGRLARMEPLAAGIVPGDENEQGATAIAPVGSSRQTWHVGVMNHLSRRTFMCSLGAAATIPAFAQSHAAAGPILTRAIPSTGEQIPAIGLGTWITFNVGNDEKLRVDRARVMQTFF